MIKKTLSILLLTLLFFNLLIPSTITAKAEEEIRSTAPMASYLTIHWTNDSEPIIPIDERIYYHIKIDYYVTMGRLGVLLLPFFVGRQVDIKLDIIDLSPGCSANIAIRKLITLVQPYGTTTSQIAEISVELDKDAPADESGYVKIKATIPPIKGPFGLITFIDGLTQNFSIEFKPEYYGLIHAEFPQGDSIEISPYTETIIPINVTNLGNGRTRVRLLIMNDLESFDITTEEIIIDVDKNETAELVLFADHKFDEEEIEIFITPSSAENPGKNFFGESTFLRFTVANDGSYVEEVEEPFEIDLTMLIIFLVIIVLIIVHISVAYKILKRK
jgi:hypothetical protein